MTFKKAEKFIYRNARPLDLARWQYHFENGSKENVLTALSYYQNEDGGFGHALEADSWNPNSSPIQTWAAAEILWEIDFIEKDHKIIKGILNYLQSGENFNGHFWRNSIKSNNDFPHAPWWHVSDTNVSDTNYNPTVCLAGFIIRFADKNSRLFESGCEIAKEAVTQLMSDERENDMHTISCYIRFMQYCEGSSQEFINLSDLRNKLTEQVNKLITKDITQWKTSYICKPSQFFNSDNSVFYKGNEETALYECEYIVKTQLTDGSWNIPWGWKDFPKEWAISENWWKSNIIINNIRYLKGFNKL
jgi:hypothetical protein